MRNTRNIFLIGPMGAGKSTIGRHLAKMVKLEFYDSDQVIEERTGADISWIYDVEGEDGFRKREEGIIDELSKLSGIVLATGGGAIVSSANRSVLAARGAVVYLQTSFDAQMQRIARDKKRPLLQQAKAPESDIDLQAIMVEREPLYVEIADLAVDTDGRSMKAVTADIIEWLDET